MKFKFSALLIIFLLMPWNAQSQSSKEYKVRTYLFMGNSFIEKFNEQIDTADYTYETRYKGDKIMERYYPNYQRASERTEIYHYDEIGEIEKIVIATKNRNSKHPKVDSTVYQYKQNKGDYDMVVKSYSNTTLEQHYTFIGDTSIVDEFINDHYSHTMREYKMGDTVKVRQIIKPEISKVINTSFYDEFGNDLRWERTEDGKTEPTLSFYYKYDALDRVLERRTYFEPTHALMSTEIKIYE